MIDVFSVIIPTYNEEKLIKGTLISIKNMMARDFRIELILVDNLSNDHTVDIAKPYCSVIEILPDATIAGLRNHGARIASGKYLGFIDADCRPSREWAMVAKKHLDGNSETGVVGSFYSTVEKPNWVEKAWNDMRKRSLGRVSFLPAGNIAVRGEEFLKLGGFPEALITGEDYALCLNYRKAGYCVWNEKEMVSVHYGNFKSLKAIYKSEAWYGQGMLNTVKSGVFSRIFIAANLHLIGIILILVGLFVSLCKAFLPAVIILTCGFALVFFTISLCASKATLKSGKWKNLIFYMPIFSAYLFGRTKSLLYLYCGRKIVRK